MSDMSNRRHFRYLAGLGLLTGAGVGLGLGPLGSSGHPGVVHHAALTSSSCGGPQGAAYVADPGFQGFTAVNTANCDVIQTYNVDDLPVPNSGDTNFDGSDAGIALSGTTLWFAVTAKDNVAAINTTSLNPKNFNPAETLVPVGFMPTRLAVTPDGSQVWVVDSGPQTSTSSLFDAEVIDTSTDTVVAHLATRGDPTDVAFAPDGSQAYVTTTAGLEIYQLPTDRPVGFVPGLGSPKSVAVAPNGADVYVTETLDATLATISTRTDRVVQTTPVGQEPWQAVVSSDGAKVYVANPDSDSVSVVDAATGGVSATFAVSGAPATLGLTPDGSQLWVAGNDSAILTVIDTATGQTVGTTNLGGNGANSGDGFGPTDMVLTSTPTPGS